MLDLYGILNVYVLKHIVELVLVESTMSKWKVLMNYSYFMPLITLINDVVR